ncbi:hypothetical protein BMETH_2175345453431, partial [methanotrophic bacterial endosymbiont of Bathymodiolus sp.]
AKPITATTKTTTGLKAFTSIIEKTFLIAHELQPFS